MLGGLNLFAFVRNPNTWVDPYGLTSKCPPAFPKTWDDMSPDERKAFQHTYSRHAGELGLPNFKQSNAEQHRQQFNNVAGYIKDNATSVQTVNKLVGIKGSGVPATSQQVRFYEATFHGTRYYYYETLDGRFVSAGKAR